MLIEQDCCNDAALFDRSLPAIVRGFLAINNCDATERMAIKQAGFMPRLFAQHSGRACEIVMVSRLGDVGITHKDGGSYDHRCSIYELSDFTLTSPWS